MCLQKERTARRQPERTFKGWKASQAGCKARLQSCTIYLRTWSMRKLLSMSARMSSKKENFFWKEINPCVKEAEYAVRGVVPTLAVEIKEAIQKGDKTYPFDEVTFCNIGNPQEFHQKPITFFREVLSCVVNPDLINNPSLNPDARQRAKRLLDEIVSSGSYTHSLGIHSIRENVARFIARQDKVPAPPVENIILTEGASQGVHVLFNTLILGKQDSILIPIPQYPLYTAAISLYGGSTAPYFMDEDNGWQLDLNEMQRALTESKQQGKTPKALVVINPGNPTGSILSKETLKKVIEFSVRNRLVLVADEVYRENIYKEGVEFVSMRQALQEMSPQIRDNCELASLHSVSKGLLGECGMRGGYLYLHNFNPSVYSEVVKLKSINLCSNSLGQVMVDCLVNPPLQGVSQQTKQQFESEYKALLDSLKYRAKIVTKYLNSMTNVQCRQVEGAMYAFPSIKFSKKAMAAAEKEGKVMDLFYCLQVLKNTGIALVPGSGFRQVPGTFHFRITTLILPEAKLQHKLKAFKDFNDQFHAKYAD